MKKIYLLLIVLAVFFAPLKSTRAQWLLTDDFSSPASGTNINGNGWTAHSGAGTNPIKVAASGLTYAGYYGSAIGNSISLTTSGEDDNRTYTAINSGSAYAAAMINVSAAQATGDYFFHLGTSTSTFNARLFIKSSGAGFVVGISKVNTSPVYGATVYSFNTTYLVVIKYTYIAGLTNDRADAFVLTSPSMPNVEPAATVSSTDSGTGTDATTLTAVFVRQGTAANAPTLQIDGIRVAASWSDLFFTPSVTTGATGVGATSFTANWGAVSGTTNYYLDVSTDSGFGSFVAGYNNKDMSTATSCSVTGLTAGLTYYYRVRAYNGSITGINSATASITTVSIVLSGTEAGALAYTENDPATIVTATTTLASSAANLAGGVIQITGNYQNGQDVLSFTPGNGITGSWDAATGKLTLSGSSAFANYQTALQSVTYQNTSESPIALTRTVSFSVNDGTTSGNTVTRNIAVTSVNDLPTLSGIEVGAISYITGPTVQVTNTIALSDLDNPTMQSAAVQISSNYSAQDVLLFTNQNGITGTWVSGTGTMNLTGQASREAYQIALRSILFQNPSTSASALTRTISFTVNDGITNSVAATRNINVDNAPLLSTIESQELSYNPGGGAVQITAALTATDADNANLSGGTVAFAGYYEFGKDILAFVDANGITGNWDAATGRLTLSGVSSVANYQAALRSIQYSNISSTPVRLKRTISFVLNDGTANGNTVTRVINLGFSPLTLTGGESANLLYKKGDGEKNITQTLTINSPSSPSINSATIKITGNYVPGEDFLVCSSQNQIISVWYQLEGKIELSWPSSVMNYQTALRSVTYKNVSDNPSLASRTYSITVSDGYNTSNEYIRTIDVSAPRNVAVSPNISEGGTVTGSGTFFTGTSITVSAAANTGYTFVNWTENGTVVASTPSYSFNLTANRTLVANFTINQYLLNIAVLPEAGGTVAGAGTFNYGSNVTVTAVPNTGYSFVNWSNGSTVLSTSPSYSFTLNSNTNLTANFILLPVLTLSTESITVNAVAGTATINVTNTGGSTLNWTAVSNIFWVKIVSGLSGTNNGTITLSVNNNNSIARVGTITITANGSIGSPKTVEIRQGATTVGIENLGSGIPTAFRLDQNYPNPFNPTTKIRFGVPQACKVTVVVYNIMGEEIDRLVDGEFSPGNYETNFNAANLSSGLYLYKITAGEFVQVRKMILTK